MKQFSPEQWVSVLEDVEPPTYAEVTIALADRTELSTDQARGAIDDALASGVLDEDTSSAFGVLTVGERVDEVEQTGQNPYDEQTAEDDNSAALEAFAISVEFFHEQLDVELHASAAYDTPREYFREGRGWSDRTITDKRLGYAPANGSALLDRLMREGYDRAAIRGTGLFTDDLKPLWRGRYVFPYFDADGRPCYAISRTADHPEDWFQDQKYAKANKIEDYSRVDEPIYGLETVRDGEPVVITEGIADTITAHAAGYPCVSPVTTQYKRSDRERLVDVLEEHDVPRVYIVQDAEPPSSDLNENDELTLTQFGEGTRGAVATGGYLADHGIDAWVADLPRHDLEKVDLDIYLNEWGHGDLTPILASAKPVDHHPAHDPKQIAIEAAVQDRQHDLEHKWIEGGNYSALYNLDIRDVTGLSWGFRGKNPLGHHGGERPWSEDYFVLEEPIGLAYEYKYKVAYNALTYLLCEAGERRASSPNGQLDGGEICAVWVHAKRERYIPEDDPIPHRALRHIAVSEGLCDSDDIEDGWKLPLDAYNGALDVLEETRGVEPGREPLRWGKGDSGAMRFYEECAPPLDADVDPIDVDARRDAMTGDLYDEFGDRDGVTIWAHNPGEGKTTSAAIAAAERDRDHVVLLPKHENCREFQLDEKKPDGYYHLKGAGQPRDDECMDVRLVGERCERHIGDCPTMCPIYSELETDHSLRQKFDALVGAVGVRKAHAILEFDEYDWHGDKCAWLKQWNHVDSADRIVTVHDYTPLKSVRNQGDVIIDDLQGSLIEESTVGLNELSRCQQALRNFSNHADTDRVAVTMEKLAKFVDDLVMILSDADAESADLAEIAVPSFPNSCVRTFDSREQIPDGVPDSQIEETSRREYVGEGGQYIKETVYQATVPDLAETLAQAKHAYNDILLARIQDGRWSDTPFSLDGVFAALGAAGADDRACRIAAATPAYLTDCPRCGSRLAPNDGRVMCTEGGCGWTQGEDPLTTFDTTPARIDAEPAADATGVHGITTRRVPAADELPAPSDVLVLDATPRKRVTGALFGVGEDQVTVVGGDSYSLPNATVAQIADGAYHRSTLADSVTARQRTQSAIEQINEMHDDVLYVTLKKAMELFEWPDDAEVMHYYALRGLDRDADAVVLVGAPHPNENTMRADARVLSQDNPRVRAGGTELSTRQGSAPPVYRKLNYTDGDDCGLAVASKTYTGLTGDLFDASHADEIEQAAHRNRPILATETDERHVYLLTNVATRLPVDRVVGFDAFLNPTEHHLDVRDSALELLDAMANGGHDDDAEYATDGGIMGIEATVSEWYESAQNAGMDVSKRTIRNALSDLADAGLVREGRYAQRRGRLQTLTELGAQVAARTR